LYGLTIGTRTAVIFSPHDLTCGWDGFVAPPTNPRCPQAPRGPAMLAADAIKLGVNIVGYIAAMRQVAETEAVTRQYQAPRQRVRQQMALARLRYQGEWHPDPNSVTQWLRPLATESSLAVDFEVKPV